MADRKDIAAAGIRPDVLRAAIAALACGGAEVLFTSDLAARAGIRRHSARAFTPFPLGMGEHSFVEICLLVRGRAALRLGERVLPMDRPTMVVIESGQPHCEGVCRSADEYDVVWVLATSASQASLVLSSRHKGRWLPPWHHPAPPHAARQLADLLASIGPRAHRRATDALGALLLSMLAEALGELTWQGFLTPDRPAAADRRLELLRQFKAVLDTRLDQPLTLESLAELFHLTPNYLNSIFRRWTGEAVHAYLNRRRMETALELCRNSDLQVKQIALRVGFTDPLYFSRAFRSYYGTSPRAAREDAGLDLRGQDALATGGRNARATIGAAREDAAAGEKERA